MLVTEAVVQSSDGLSLTMTTYPVSPGVVRGLRNQVMDLAFSELRSPDTRRAVRAARAIGSSLVQSSLHSTTRPRTRGEDRWTPTFAETIERVGSLAADSALDPARGDRSSRGTPLALPVLADDNADHRPEGVARPA